MPSKKLIVMQMAALTLIVSLVAQTNAAVIIEDKFDGDPEVPLNGTTPGTFSSAITSAGGSGTWDAADGFADNGVTDPALYQNAFLNMGTYVDDAAGTAEGLFILSATLTRSAGGGGWGGFGFFDKSATTGQDFTRNGYGHGFYIYRGSGELDGFAGPGSTNAVDGPDAQTGTQLLTIVLDLTPAGGYDGTTNFGTIRFIQGDSTETPFGSYTYTEDITFGKVGLSQASYDGTYSNFTLEQVVPEPATMSLLGFGVVALLRRRRK